MACSLTRKLPTLTLGEGGEAPWTSPTREKNLRLADVKLSASPSRSRGLRLRVREAFSLDFARLRGGRQVLLYHSSTSALELQEGGGGWWEGRKKISDFVVSFIYINFGALPHLLLFWGSLEAQINVLPQVSPGSFN